MDDKATTAAVRKEPGWLKPATDYVPLIVFLVVYYREGILDATAALIIAALAALVVSYLVSRRIPYLPLIAAGLVGIFGGLTLYFEDEFWIKIKPTVLQLLFAVVIYGSYLLGKPVLKMLLNTAFPLHEVAWRGLSLRFAIFFVVMALANEVVWRTQDTETWVWFDTIGQMAITFVFIMAQIPFMLKHRVEDEEETQGSD